MSIPTALFPDPRPVLALRCLPRVNSLHYVEEQIVDLEYLETGGPNVVHGRTVHIRTNLSSGIGHQVHHHLKRIVTAARVFEHVHVAAGAKNAL